MSGVSDTFDVSVPSGKNYDKAEFRLWLPAGLGVARGVLVVVPGSNGDGRDWVERPAWREMAAAYGFGLVCCFLTDHKHPNMAIEEYAKVADGSGQALLDALSALAEKSGHPEIAVAPLALWGISAGGEFNYEFACWRPDRVAAFVVNKGGIYYTALAPEAARAVPGLFFIGGSDSPFRNDIIKGIYAVNRRVGAIWALAEEPFAVHELGRSVDASKVFFDEVLPLRLGEGGALRPLEEKAGLLGDPYTRTVSPYDEAHAKKVPTAWFATEKLSKAWLAVEKKDPL